jgi:predicted nucleotidyltransferase
LELFGSAASGAFRAHDSDLDLLVEVEATDEPGYAGRYFALLEALEQLFRRPVDLVVASAVTNPYLRESIEQGRILLYAA